MICNANRQLCVIYNPARAGAFLRLSTGAARRGGVSTPTDIAQRAARITRALHNLGSDWKWNRKCKTCPVFVKAGSGQGDRSCGKHNGRGLQFKSADFLSSSRPLAS